MPPLAPATCRVATHPEDASRGGGPRRCSGGGLRTRPPGGHRQARAARHRRHLPRDGCGLSPVGARLRRMHAWQRSRLAPRCGGVHRGARGETKFHTCCNHGVGRVDARLCRLSLRRWKCVGIVWTRRWLELKPYAACATARQRSRSSRSGAAELEARMRCRRLGTATLETIADGLRRRSHGCQTA